MSQIHSVCKQEEIRRICWWYFVTQDSPERLRESRLTTLQTFAAKCRNCEIMFYQAGHCLKFMRALAIRLLLESWQSCTWLLTQIGNANHDISWHIMTSHGETQVYFRSCPGAPLQTVAPWRGAHQTFHDFPYCWWISQPLTDPDSLQAAQYWALLLPNWPLREDFCEWAMRSGGQLSKWNK